MPSSTGGAGLAVFDVLEVFGGAGDHFLAGDYDVPYDHGLL